MRFILCVPSECHLLAVGTHPLPILPLRILSCQFLVSFILFPAQLIGVLIVFFFVPKDTPICPKNETSFNATIIWYKWVLLITLCSCLFCFWCRLLLLRCVPHRLPIHRYELFAFYGFGRCMRAPAFSWMDVCARLRCHHYNYYILYYVAMYVEYNIQYNQLVFHARRTYCPLMCVLCVQSRDHPLPKTIGQYTENGEKGANQTDRTERTAMPNSIERNEYMYIHTCHWIQLIYAPSTRCLLKFPFFAFINYLYTSLCQPSPLQFTSSAFAFPTILLMMCFGAKDSIFLLTVIEIGFVVLVDCYSER